MNCKDFIDMIDAFIDGELTPEQEKALYNHASECEQCANELAAAKAIRDAMNEMDDDVQVPLQTQAAWRRAVRAEAAKKKNKTVLRFVYGVAAVLVLALGCTAVLKNKAVPAPMTSVSESEVAEYCEDSEAMVVGADSVADAASETHNADRKYETDDYAGSVTALHELAEEYECTITETETTDSNGKHSCDVVLSLDGANAQDLLTAMAPLGTETVNTTGDLTGETVSIHIIIQEI